MPSHTGLCRFDHCDVDFDLCSTHSDRFQSGAGLFIAVVRLLGGLGGDGNTEAQWTWFLDCLYCRSMCR